MKINIKKYIYILAPLILGSLVSFFIDTSSYNDMMKENINLAPPEILFPIVWSILYLIMGYSSYLISLSKSEQKNECLYLFYLQLFINLTWTFIFFNLNMKVFALVWMLLLIIVVLFMIKCFYKINKLAAKLNIPYLLWLLFAFYLNFQIAFM